MGTRGLYSYRYRRRYRTTYNNMDSYLDGLGADLVAGIPTDPAAFKKWVEDMKHQLQEGYKRWMLKTKKIKEKGLPVPEAPYEMSAPRRDVFIEYTYVIDFDRNVFTVNGHSHLPLDAIPRGPDPYEAEWMDAVEDRKHPARILHPTLVVSPPDPRHLALYDEYGATQSLELPSREDPFPFPTCGVIMDYVFRQFRFVYSPMLDNIDEYEPTDPNFFALVQGIVTLATWGRFCMSSREPRPGVDDDLARFEPAWSNLSVHSADKHFWHFATLIVLETGLEDAQRLRAAVGKAAGLWHVSDTPMKNPTAFIVSVKSVVMVRISDDAVFHSAPIELCGATMESQPHFETFSQTPGFDLLKRHFTPALPALNASPRLALPHDVLERIFDMCDDETLLNLTYTCKTVRTQCHMRPRFRIGEYRLLYHVGGNEFTALNDSGVTVPVVVGNSDCAIKSTLPGGSGFALVLKLRTEDAEQVHVELMGLRCLPAAQEDADSMVVDEAPTV